MMRINKLIPLSLTWTFGFVCLSCNHSEPIAEKAIDESSKCGLERKWEEDSLCLISEAGLKSSQIKQVKSCNPAEYNVLHGLRKVSNQEIPEPVCCKNVYFISQDTIKDRERNQFFVPKAAYLSYMFDQNVDSLALMVMNSRGVYESYSKSKMEIIYAQDSIVVFLFHDGIHDVHFANRLLKTLRHE